MEILFKMLYQSVDLGLVLKFSKSKLLSLPTQPFMSDSLRHRVLQPARVLCPWDFPRQEYCSGLPFPTPADLPDSGSNLCLLQLLHCSYTGYTFQVNSLPAEPLGKPKNTGVGILSLLQRIFLTQELNWISCIAGRFFTN